MAEEKVLFTGAEMFSDEIEWTDPSSGAVHRVPRGAATPGVPESFEASVASVWNGWGEDHFGGWWLDRKHNRFVLGPNGRETYSFDADKVRTFADVRERVVHHAMKTWATRESVLGLLNILLETLPKQALPVPRRQGFTLRKRG